jgi:SAM-dependent methyltransferase
MPLFISTVGLSAFLLFLVQPLIAKQILPWFGGSAAVWTTCMVFFQLVLLAGYFYADWVVRRLTPRRQALLHGALLALSLLLLPITPSAAFKPDTADHPVGQILLLLAATIGLPYLMLSTTGPLVQAWFARHYAGTPRLVSVWRLYAWSNVASMAALLLYPPVIEPLASARTQSLAWSAGYAVFALLAAASGWLAARRPAGAADTTAAPADAAPASAPPGIATQAGWLALAALGSVLLLAVTTHITQNVASVPFLWVLPLALYLLSFILTFDGRGWYWPRVYPTLVALMATAMMAGLVWRPTRSWTPADGWAQVFEVGLMHLKLAVPLYAGGLFVLCMFMHGELVARRPAPAHLTRFYLMVSLGGATGGLLVGIVAPLVFNAYWELPAALLLSIAAVALLGRRWVRVVGLVALLLSAGIGWRHVAQVQDGALEIARDFYGTLRIQRRAAGDDPQALHRMVHGVIAHGEQYRDERRREPTAYYGPSSGVARALVMLREQAEGPQRVGLIGLGVGTLATYGRNGDTYRFYELAPLVLKMAQRHFSYLRDSAATVQTELGDARLVLEREPPQRFDLLAVDAFSSDSIPVHLITREAMDVYRRHLRDGGVVAIHVSNRYLALAPVVAAAAAEAGLRAWLVEDVPSDDTGLYESDWVLVTANDALLATLARQAIGKAADAQRNGRPVRAWTDDFNNLFEVLR